MKKHAYLALSLVAPIAILTGCNQSDVEKQVQPQTQEQTPQTEQDQTVPSDNQTKEEGGEVQKTKEELIKEKFDAQNQTIEDLNTEVDYYRTFIKDFTSTFSTKQMNEFIDKEWSYKLVISNINFPKNGVLELANNTFDLVLTEDKVPYSVIPDEMSLKGKLEGDIKSQISFTFEEVKAKDDTKEILKEVIKEDSNDKHSVITYSFTDVPSGTIIKGKVSDELKKELNLDKNELEIKIQ